MAADVFVPNPTGIKAVGPFATANVGVGNPTGIKTVAGAFAQVVNPTTYLTDAPEAFYTPAPAHRMLWDVDGTRMRKYGPSAWSEYGFVEIEALNDEDGATTVTDTVATATSYVVYFPEKRDLAAIFLSLSLATPGNEVYVEVQTSTNTTNGVNGTWVTRVASSPVSASQWGTSPTNYRSPKKVAAFGIRAVRLVMSAAVPASGWILNSLHLYGVPSAGANPDRLEVWHPTLDERVSPTYFDWGKSPRGSSADRTFRVKNLSPSRRASAIMVYCDALTDTYPSVAYQHYVAMGSVFANSLTIASLEPGRISPVITLRRITPSDATMGVWSPRLRVVNGGWL